MSNGQLVYHYTDRDGYNGIRAQPDWVFVARRQHRYPSNPHGAYFITLPPDAPNLGRKLRIGREKREFVFEFAGTDGLQVLNNDRTLDRAYVLYSPVDYVVSRERQQYSGETDQWSSVE